jgi:hypothetical protein
VSSSLVWWSFGIVIVAGNECANGILPQLDVDLPALLLLGVWED